MNFIPDSQIIIFSCFQFSPGSLTMIYLLDNIEISIHENLITVYVLISFLATGKQTV